MKYKKNSLFAYQVIDLVRNPGSSRQVVSDVVMGEKMGEGLVAVLPQTALHLEAQFEATHEGIFVNASVSTTARGECCRCLNSVTLPIEVDFQEFFAYPSKEAYDYEVHDNHVDLEPVVRDAVVLSLPFQPVCRADCPGIRFENLFSCDEPSEDDSVSEELEPSSTGDPRWGVLAQFQASQIPKQNSNQEGTQ